MTSQCGPRRPKLNETKMRRRYDVACRVGHVVDEEAAVDSHQADKTVFEKENSI